MKRRTIIYGVVFSIASYATAAALALGTAAYAINVFTDPIVTLTIPLIIISIGLQAMNEKYSVLLLALISAVLYIPIPFMVPTLIIAGVVDELITWFIGYRSFKAVMTNTTVVGTITGVGSVIFGILMLGMPKTIPFNNLILAGIIFTVIYLVESAIMGYISYKLGSYLIKSGIIKG